MHIEECTPSSKCCQDASDCLHSCIEGLFPCYQFIPRLCNEPCCVLYVSFKKERNKTCDWGQHFRCHLFSSCWSWEFVSICFLLWENKKASKPLSCCSAPKAPQSSRSARCWGFAEALRAPPKFRDRFHSHACMINRSITSIKNFFHVISHYYITPALIRDGNFHRGNCCKTWGNITQSNTQYFTSSVWCICLQASGSPVLFHSALMEGLQLSVADRHLGGER